VILVTSIVVRCNNAFRTSMTHIISLMLG